MFLTAHTSARNWELSHSAMRLNGASVEQTERRLGCLEMCLDQLPSRQRELLLDYHGGDRHIERRRALAASLSIPLNALRIRVHRIRTAVEHCVSGCAGLAPNSARDM